MCESAPIVLLTKRKPQIKRRGFGICTLMTSFLLTCCFRKSRCFLVLMTFNLLLINPLNPRLRVCCQILGCSFELIIWTHICKLKNMQTHAQLSMESFPNFTEGNKSALHCEMGRPFSATDDFLCTITIKGFQAGI